jgi:hypothetical protein
MNRAALFGVRALVMATVISLPAEAGILNIYTALDPGAGPSDPHPNSSAVEAAFQTAAGPALHNFVTFENMSVGTGVPLSFSSGTITASNPSALFLAQVQSGGSAAMGYNTTPGGSNYFRVDQNNGTVPTVVTFTFDSPIWAFGAYVTGLGTAAGALNVWFDDGVIQTIPVEGSSKGGVLFFGFISDNRTNSVTFQLDPVDGFVNDGIGIDDVQFASNPEPATLSLVGLAAVAFGLVRRRRS